MEKQISDEQAYARINGIELVKFAHHNREQRRLITKLNFFKIELFTFLHLLNHYVVHALYDEYPLIVY